MRAPGGAGAREAGPAGGGQPQAVPADGVGGCGCGGGAGAAVAPPRGAAGGATARIPFALAPVTVVAGHYGVGKTNLSLNLAFDAALSRRPRDAGGPGRGEPLLPLERPRRRARGARRAPGIAPVFAGAGSSLDVPSLTGAVAPAIEAAWEAAAAGVGGARVPPAVGGAPGGEAGMPAAATPAERAPDAAGACDEAPAAPQAPRELVIVDAGGDDAGATALGRFAADVAAGPYALLYVANRFRNLTQAPEAAAEAAGPIQEAARLAATAVVNNSHVMGETDWEHVREAWPFGEEVACLLGLPLACTTVPEALVRRENGDVPSFASGRRVYYVRRYVRTPWEAQACEEAGARDEKGMTWHE